MIVLLLFMTVLVAVVPSEAVYASAGCNGVR